MYNELFNMRANKSFRQRLRNEPTVGEKVLWNQLKNKSLNGFKFRRQQGVGPYIVDFYCASARLVIEVDGESHMTINSEKRDVERECYLITKGLHVIRFTDEQILNGLEGVVEEILINLGSGLI